MMPLYKKLIAACAACLLAIASAGQKSFVEGEIVYKVRIEKNLPDATLQTLTGTLSIRLKGNDVIKELNIDQGFRNTILLRGNAKSAYSLRSIGKNKFALHLDPEHITAKMQKCAQLHRQDLPGEVLTIGGFRTEKARVSCNDAAPVTIYFTREWQVTNPYIFDDFPSFGYLPLSWDIINEEGSKLHFELLSIEAKPIDNAAFQIPQGYKVISQDEYRSWQH